MDKQVIKEIMYGGISELMQNKRFYYRSSSGYYYSHWTDEGNKALVEYISHVTAYIYDAEQTSLDNRSKELLLDTLKS